MPIPGNFLSPTTESIDPNTSGWSPKSNCGPLVKGVGGRNGDGCLVTKSLLAGEVQARTVSSYPVVAGAVYQVFADTAGAVPERIGIRWLNTAGTEISVTWSLTTAAASSSWHRVGVAGAAPVGTATAQVLLSSTETAGAVSHYWENVYLGLPIRTGGNLFGFGTESTEIDASGWAVEANATLSRQVPVVSWAVDNYLAGGHTLAITAVAAGNTAAVTVDRPGVTPGIEYTAHAYLQPPVSSAQAWIELRYYDGGGSQIAAQRSTLAAPGTGMYRQTASLVAPPGATTCSAAAGIVGASAGQVLRLETVVIAVAPSLQSGTVVPYADGSMEQGIAGWTVSSGVATLARSTPWGATALEGSYSLAVTSATATASMIRSARFPTPGGAGLNWRAQISARPTAGTWASVNIKIRWYDAANVDLGTSSGTTWTVPGAVGWYVMPTDAATPAGATQAAIELTATASAVNSVLNIDKALLWRVLPQTAVTAATDGGYITLTLRELPADQRISLYRETPDGIRTLVRGPAGLIDRQLITSDLMVLEDHEAPMNTPVRYRMQFYDAAGTYVSSRSSELVQVTLADINEAWLKDPGNPQRSIKIMVQSAPDWTRPIEQSAYAVKGRRNKVVLSGRRQGLEGDLSIWTRSDSERLALHLLLDSGNVLLWQAVPGMGVTDMYVSVGQITEARTGGTAQEPWRAWTLPLVEADMPVTTGVNGAAGRTWQDVIAEFETWADELATYATNEDLFLDRRTG
ncbi:hypothetical protein [Streptomyces sp. KN37]|uniref:hypothetical protein n=1 Tax=Streptomyces sp. KN37 TaxID=3090667 RepID=UPI002A7622E2|nr:hypothetical protein [Streptomyces sp. KN37]WPO74034.1 hypothetical protein R9806_27145 [Streptomyces sp. KN37]